MPCRCKGLGVGVDERVFFPGRLGGVCSRLCTRLTDRDWHS